MKIENETNYQLKIALIFLFFLVYLNAGKSQSEEDLVNPDYTCVLKTIVDNLYLRSEPSVKGKKLKKLSKGYELLWTNIKSSKDIVEWNGEKITGYWYKVLYNVSKDRNVIDQSLDSLGWVFGKGIDLELINFKDLKDKTLTIYNNEWVKVGYVSKKIYDSTPRVYPNWIPNKKVYRYNNNIESKKYLDYKLNFLNGKSYVKKNDPEESTAEYFYVGELKDLGFYITCYAACCAYYTAYRKSDGKEFGIEGISTFIKKTKSSTEYIPIVAQDHHTILCRNGCEPGGMNDNFWLYFDTDKITQIFRYKHLYQEDFKFTSPTSGIAEYRIYNNTNGKFTTKYIKITLKK